MFSSVLKAVAATTGAIALVMVGAPTVAAPAAYHDPEVAWTGGNVQVSPDGSTVHVLGKYRCWGGTTGTHLWVSVKQGPRLSEPDQTGSSYADAWYDTNWNFENSETGLTVDCDGHWHVTRAVLKNVFGELHDGTAYIQFCLFDNSSTEDNFPQGFAQDYGWRTVRVP